MTTVFASLTQVPNQSWGRLQFNSRWHVAKLIGALDRHGLLGKPLKRASAASVDVERRLITAGAHVVARAPNAIADLFERIRIVSPTNRNTQLVGRAFPGLLTMLRKSLDCDGRNWVMEHVHAYVGATLESSVPVLWRQRATRSLTAAVSVGRQLGVRPERVESLAIQFGITPTRRIVPSGRRMVTMAPSEVERIRAGLADDVSMSAAADRFGLSVSRLKRLQDAGCIDRAKEGVSAASIEVLIDKVAEHAICLNEHDRVDILSVTEAMRLYVPVSRTVDFFDALGSSIPVTKASVITSSVRELYVSREHVRRLYVESTAHEMLSIPEAAKKLGLKQEVAYHLVRVGLLKTCLLQSARRASNGVSLEDLSNFEMQYAPLSRLAKEAGVNPRSSLKWARAINLDFVSGPSIDGGRQFIVSYRRL